ncbi:MAG: peptidylprolyl isomerase [Pseudomonadota bacterium]|jgi:peptidyl-prolyl cis-trans isomerase D
MFDFVRKHTRLFQFILLLLIFPSFVLFGVQGYNQFNEGGKRDVAKVDGKSISRAELDNAHRQQVERMRQQMPDVDVKLFDTPEAQQATLDGLVRERVLQAASDKAHLVTTDERLQRMFLSDPQMAFLRNADGSVNKDMLAAQGMSSEMFAQRLRRDASVQQVLRGLSGSVVATAAVTNAGFDALLQQREVQVQRFDAKDFLAQAKPTEADLQAYYKEPKNAAQFQSPEQARVEYVVLDIDAIKKSITVSDDELRKYYTENLARYTTAEERRASHILIKADKSAPAAERAAAKTKAEALMAEVRKNPKGFADVARKNSQDPGSAANGGDLDFFGRGAMVKPFEDAAFGLKVGEVSGVVESDFGFHIIQLTAQRGGEKRSFEAARAEIDEEVRKQLAQKRFAEAAVDFGNMVYEQADSLKPAADKFKLEIQSADAVTRQPAPGAKGALASAKFLQAVFGNDAANNKRNTDAVEIGANQLAAGRLVNYSAARTLPLADVGAKVRERVLAQQAAKLAVQAGAAKLAAVKAAPQTALDGAAVVVSRAQLHDLPRAVVDAALRAAPEALPTALGVDLGEQGYAVLRVVKLAGRDPAAADPVKAKAQYAQAWGDAEAQAYYAALKSRFNVTVNAPAVAASSAAN